MIDWTLLKNIIGFCHIRKLVTTATTIVIV